PGAPPSPPSSPASASWRSTRSRGGNAATAVWAARACSTLDTGDGTRGSGCGGTVYTSRLPTRGTDHAPVDPARVHPAAWLPVAAQATPAPPPIEPGTTAEQLKAAGLDKLSAQELANLNAWLNRTITTETAKAAEQAAVQTRERVESESRGFFHFGSDQRITSRITGQFDGFRKGKTYTLDNGQQWRQTDTEIGRAHV